MLVVCAECKTVAEAASPGTVPRCEACRHPLANVPEGSSKGLAFREERRELAAGQTHVLSLSVPRSSAVGTILVGLGWTMGLARVAALVWSNGVGGGLRLFGLFFVVVVLACLGLPLVRRGVLDLANRLELSVTKGELRVMTTPVFEKGKTVGPIPVSEILGFSVEPDDFARSVVYALLRDGQGKRLPYVFARRAHAVFVADKLGEMVAEHSNETPYRGLCS